METRQPAVAGLFYAGRSDELAQDVDRMLNAAERPPLNGVRALVVPHAGYVYSGDVAASAFSCLPRGARYRYILLIGPSHRVAFYGMAVPETRNFKTPLGEFPLATAVIAEMVEQGWVSYNEMAHQQEHCLEVQLPFLQRSEIEGPLVPVVVGDATPGQVAELIRPALADPEVLTLISTDMSHYHAYDEAREIDGHTHKRILEGATDIRGDEACGYMGLNGLQQALLDSGYQMHLLKRCNSGDVSGDRNRVVGYGAYAVY